MKKINDPADSAKPLLFGINPNGESNGLTISYWAADDNGKIKIIGNRFDNPELLEA